MRRPGLRARVTLLFSAGALLLATALAVSTYHLTARHLVSERERTAIRAAYFDAAVVDEGLSGDNPDVVEVLRAIDAGQSRKPLVRRDETWFGRGADDGLTTAVPIRLLALVGSGEAGLQRIRFDGQPALVVGIPLSRRGDGYFEVQALSEVQSTLRTLSGTLTVVALVVTAAAAVLSSWTARRALRPLLQVTDAAKRVSEGDLAVRMRAAGDADLDRLTTAFNGMVDEVSSRMERDRRFAADVSHELRSPLQTLTAASSVLAAGTARLEPRTATAARLVAEEAERFTSLVQDLLAMSRAEQPAVLEPVDVAELVRGVMTRLGVPADTVRLEPGIGTWPLDRRRVEQLLTNLVENAQRHGGGVHQVSAARTEGCLAIDVDDTGPGIPEEERERVFDRFARGRAANARGARDGTGLGLALVAQHAAAHAGTVCVLDRPGGGCRIRVELPAGRTG